MEFRDFSPEDAGCLKVEYAAKRGQSRVQSAGPQNSFALSEGTNKHMLRNSCVVQCENETLEEGLRPAPSGASQDLHNAHVALVTLSCFATAH